MYIIHSVSQYFFLIHLLYVMLLNKMYLINQKRYIDIM